MVNIAECESFSISIDGKVEEWESYDAEGWTKRLVTGKSITISVTAKRCIGDAGNDYVANTMTATGAGCDSRFVWNLPSGAKLEGDCVINVTNNSAGDATAVGGLAFDIMSHGKPTFTPAG